MNICKNIIYIITVSLTTFINLIAQSSNIKFGHIGLEQGLSQSTVNAIVQDAQGFMWFGTQDGLNRYDGYSITTYRHNPSDINSISGNIIRQLICDNRGNLWIAIDGNGIDKYDISKNKFYHYKNDGKNTNTISNDSITCLFEDSEKNVWIGTNFGLNKYKRKENKFYHFFFNPNKGEQLNENAIRAICEDKNKNIWVGTYNGIFKSNLKSELEFSRVRYLNTNPATLYGDNITALYLDRNGYLWIGTYDQFLKRYDTNSNTFIIYSNTIKNIRTINEDSENNLWIGSTNMSLRILNLETCKVTQVQEIRYDPVNTIYKDKNGALWIGTGFRGIFNYDQNRNRFKHYLNEPGNPNVVMTILEDNDGGLWVGTFGQGLIYFDSKRKTLKTYKHNPADPNSISSDEIFTLYITKDGTLWVGTIRGGLNYFDKSSDRFKKYIQNSPVDNRGLSNNDITSLYENSDGNLVIGNVTGGIDIFNRETKKFSHYYPDLQIPNTIGGGRSVTVIKEDKTGTLWAGTLNGLKQYDKKMNKFINFSLKRSKQSNDVAGSVTSLLFTEQIIWIGTAMNGLIKFQPETNSIVTFTSDDGLPDNVILGILPDNKGNLWLSTNKGISRFNPHTKLFKNYDLNDGLQEKEFNQGAYYKSKTGEMFFGGVNGFNAFFADKIIDNEIIPPVYLTTLSVFDEKMELPNPIPENYKIELSYSQNFFSFEFAALSYVAPEKNQYTYKLEGFDNDWHIVSAQQRYAKYMNLYPGKYIMKVKGSNNDGKWNETGSSVILIVNPPYWMTWWFISLAIILFLTIIFMIYYRRVAALKKEKVLQQEISRQLIIKQEEERSRIALGLHDSIGQDLLLIKNRLMLIMKKASERRLEKGNINFKEKNYNLTTIDYLNQISADVSSVLKNVREISHDLRPPDLDQLGLTETIKSILLNMRNSTNIKVSGFVDTVDDLLLKEQEINFVRIVQEALGNVIKHAETAECKVEVSNTNNKILLRIIDYGKGFNEVEIGQRKKQTTIGLGLTGMAERVRILDGNIKIKSEPGKGTQIEIQIPIKPS